PVPVLAALPRRPPLSASTRTATSARASARAFFVATAGQICATDVSCHDAHHPPGHTRRYSRYHAHLCVCGRLRHGFIRAHAARRGRDVAAHERTAGAEISLSRGRA